MVILDKHVLSNVMKRVSRQLNKESIYKILIVASLLLIIIQKTENPLIHSWEILNYRGSQYKIMKALNSTETKVQVRALFDREYNYVELVDWVHEHLSLSDVKPRPVPKEPIEILKLGYGKCGEFTILYVGVCLAHNYEARIVINLRGNNHEWAEVFIDGEWVHVDPTSPPGVYVNDPEMYRRWNMVINLAVAFEDGSYEIVTEKYS